jgi:hypothetical protein
VDEEMTDRFTIHAVVLGLIVITLAVVGALVYAISVVDLSPEQRGSVIGALVSLGSLAAGAVAGLLAHTASNDPGGSTTTTTSSPPALPPAIIPEPVPTQ